MRKHIILGFIIYKGRQAMKKKDNFCFLSCLFTIFMIFAVSTYVGATCEYITDNMDEGWSFVENHGDSSVQYGYSTAHYTSSPQSVYAYVYGGGTVAQDNASVEISKTFSWTQEVPLTKLNLNYMIKQNTDGDAWGGFGGRDEIAIILHASDGDHVYSYIISCSSTTTGDWGSSNCCDLGTDVKYINWSNEEVSPPCYENEMEPPLRKWYTLDRNVDDDFSPDWSTVSSITILIKHYAGYLHADHFESYFDDLVLAGCKSAPFVGWNCLVYDGMVRNLERSLLPLVIEDTGVFVTNPNPVPVQAWIKIFNKYGKELWSGYLWDTDEQIRRIPPMGFAWMPLGWALSTIGYETNGREKFTYQISMSKPSVQKPNRPLVCSVEVKQVVYEEPTDPLAMIGTTAAGISAPEFKTFSEASPELWFRCPVQQPVQ